MSLTVLIAAVLANPLVSRAVSLRYQHAAKQASNGGNYTTASQLLFLADEYWPVKDGDVLQDLYAEASRSEAFYALGADLLEAAQTEEDFVKAKHLLSQVSPRSSQFPLALSKIATCDQEITRLTETANQIAQAQLDPAAPPSAEVASPTPTLTPTPPSSAPTLKPTATPRRNTATATPSSASAASDRCTGEWWSGFCLMGDDTFRATRKRGLNVIQAAAPATHYANVQQHAQYIYQATNNCSTSGCGDSVNIALSARKTYYGGQTGTSIEPQSDSELANAVVHEADHARPGMCSESMHTVMDDTWETEFRSMRNIYLNDLLKLDDYRYHHPFGESYTLRGRVLDPRAVKVTVGLVDTDTGKRIETIWADINPDRTFAIPVTFSLDRGRTQGHVSIADAEDVQKGYVGYFDPDEAMEIYFWVD